MEFDLSDLHRLTSDLGRVPGKAVPPLTAATRTSARNIRDAMRSDAAGISHAPHFAKAITDEMKPRLGVVGTEIGPDKDLRQGALGNVLYFGTSKNGPVLDLHGPLDREAPKFAKAVGDIIEDIL